MKTAKSLVWASRSSVPDFCPRTRWRKPSRCRFHRAAQKFGVDTVRVVATSALRNAHNRKSFLEWVYSSTGWQIEVISGTEEARLIHLGLVSNLRITSWPVLMVDLGAEVAS